MAKSRKKINKKPISKNKINKNLIFIAAITVIVVLIMLVYLMSLGKIENLNQGQIQQSPTGTGGVYTYTCKRDLECFSVNCKSTPSVVECVNVTKEEVYYKQCKAYWDVSTVRDSTKCACVQGFCRAP